MPSDEEMLERTLAFSGTYASDDGTVLIRRFSDGAFEYSGARFIGTCAVCSGALRPSPAGERLADVGAAVRFVATHSHGDVD